MAITIDIDTARPYQVHVGTFLLEQAGPLVRATAGGTKAVIVTDTNVGPLYQMPVKQKPGGIRLRGEHLHLRGRRSP